MSPGFFHFTFYSFLRRLPVWRTYFSMAGDCLRVAQLILAVEHTRDRSWRPLPVCCRHRGKHLESISRTSNSRNSSKNRVLHTSNRSAVKIFYLLQEYNQIQYSFSKIISTTPIGQLDPKNIGLAIEISFLSYLQAEFRFGSRHLDFLLPVRSDCILMGQLYTVF